MKKTIALFLTVALLFTLVGCGAASTGSNSGSNSGGDAVTATGTAKGYGGDLTVWATVQDGKILSVEVTEHNETSGISDDAINKLPAAIVEHQSVAVDTIAGCTIASVAVLDAARQALIAAGMSEDVITKAAQSGAQGAAGEAVEKSADVVIIGTGGAGMSAALEALEAGASVIMIDKASYMGGNTLVAGSAMNAANPEEQKKQTMPAEQVLTIEALLALEPHDDYMQRWQQKVAADLQAYKANNGTYLYDSPELHKLQTYVGGDYVANPALIEVFGDNALGSVQWLASLGTTWKDTITAAIGATWARSHNPTFDWGSAGSSFVLPQHKKVVELGAEILLGYKADTLLTENGRVTGVSGAMENGAPFTLRAGKGVIVATGGFGANVEMRERYNKHWPSLLNQKTTNVNTATGDGIVMAEAAGANLVGMEWIQLLPFSSKAVSATIENGIYLNKEGERFIAEDGRRDVISGAILKQTGQVAYALYDATEIVDSLNGVTYSGKVITEIADDEMLYYADTLEALAERIGMPFETMKATVDAYNQAVEQGSDALGRNNIPVKIDRAPFCVVVYEVMVHHTMGGIEINENAQVLDKDGKVIPGLFAAGEVTGGIHGGNRLGGNAIADVITFGRIAGQNVVK